MIQTDKAAHFGISVAIVLFLRVLLHSLMWAGILTVIGTTLKEVYDAERGGFSPGDIVANCSGVIYAVIWISIL